MSEISPQFTFSPEGVFSFERGQPEFNVDQHDAEAEPELDKGLEDDRDRMQDWVEELPGVTINEEGPAPTINVPVREALHEAITTLRASEIEDFVVSTSVLVSQQRPTGPEQVLSIRSMNEGRVSIGVHSQFQRWLNSKEVTEREALRCVKAMALPFDKTTEAEKAFGYITVDNVVIGDGGGFAIRSLPESFGFMKYFEEQENAYQVAGDDVWDWIGLEVPGAPICGIGVDRKARTGIVQSADSSRLYNMNSYHVYHPRQALSLLLGMGSLAYNAERYLGREDVFEDVEWDEPQRWPYPLPQLS